MKTTITHKAPGAVLVVFFLLSIFPWPTNAYPAEIADYTSYKGTVTDRKSGNALPFASIVVADTHISTVTNSEGVFSVKIPTGIPDPALVVSFIGYKNKTTRLAGLDKNKIRVELESSAVELPELSVISKDAEALMRAVFDKKGVNYPSSPSDMTAFYRETIKKNKTYVSLSEAVVEIDKQPYASRRSDAAKLYKARKQADYSKLDTVTFKLQGGPFNTLYLDIMKYPDMVFTDDMFLKYEFRFDRTTYMGNRLMFVVDFKQRPGIVEPLYFGKIYIDAASLALKSAVFQLNLANREEAARMFVVKKPFNADVYPVEASYRIDYNEKNGKWYYGYSRIEFGIKINWKKKLFKTGYYSVVEMAVTDWEITTGGTTISPAERLHPSVIVSDAAKGFSDPQFWGEYNVIEPEKTIESAIKKIQKQLDNGKGE
ncbi:MAG TPA: carboxypeptidase-like regulatory domain-containing protein [Paludibacter sp.]|nr:carboxypeptidase-like regulatory domain-containing protein [Paludibacter sp.]